MATLGGLGSRQRDALLATLAAGLLLLHVPVARAVPVPIGDVVARAQYHLGANPAQVVDVQAFFNTEGMTGIGAESVSIFGFDLIFSHRGFLQSAQIVLPIPEPFPEKTLVANFVDGTLVDFSSIDRGGNPAVEILPTTLFTGESIELRRGPGTPTLRNHLGSGTNVYFLTDGSLMQPTLLSGGPSPSSAPEPGTILLLGVGALGMLSVRRRRRATADVLNPAGTESSVDCAGPGT